jgi:hypothetical protein
MSDGFQKFSEAARLYAKYLAVVDEMEQLFVSDISAFLDAVQERMQAKLDTGKIEQEETKEYRSWWIEDEDTDDDDFVPYIWLERKNDEIIVPGILTVIADINEATDGEKQQLAACKSSLNLPSHCRFLDKRLFGVTITYGDGDPVEAVSEPILSILMALHRVEKKIFAARAKSGRREGSKTKR